MLSTLIVGLVIGIIFINPSIAAEENNHTFEKCPLQFKNANFNGLEGSCIENKHSIGGGSLSFVGYNSRFVAWVVYMKAGTNRYYPHIPGKGQTEKNMKRWDYIKKHWQSIKPSDPRTTYVNKDQKVVLYEIDLEKQKNCIGFSSGYGAAGRTGGNPGKSTVLNALLCPLTANSTKQETLEILESLEVNTVRW